MQINISAVYVPSGNDNQTQTDTRGYVRSHRTVCRLAFNWIVLRFLSLALLATAARSLVTSVPTTTGRVVQATPLSVASTPQPIKPAIILTEWIACSEDYGIYYAQAKGYYAENGLSVACNNMLNPQNVVQELKSGRAIIAAVSSPTAMTAWREGVQILKIIPLTTYNPVRATVRTRSGISTVGQLRNRIVGVVIGSPWARMWQNAQGLTGVPASDAQTEYVIQGGVEQLLAGEVAAVIGCSTDMSTGIAYPESEYASLWLQDVGVKSFGRVLLVAMPGVGKLNGLTQDDVESVIASTCKGYAKGSADAEGAAEIMATARKYLMREGVKESIRQIVEYNKARRVHIEDLDVWMASSDEDKAELSKYHSLYVDCP